MWMVIVDGFAFGMFPSLRSADDWASKEYPVAYAQGSYQLCGFSDVTPGGKVCLNFKK